MKYIQRAKFRATPEESKTGVDRILTFEYMGSSEFEYGLNKSVKFIRANFDRYLLTMIEVNKQMVHVFALKGQLQNAIDDVRKDALDKLQAKERTNFSKALSHNCDTNLWWNIYDHYLYFTVSDFLMEQKLFEALRPVEVKKKPFWKFW